MKVKIPFITDGLISRMQDKCLQSIEHDDFYVFENYTSTERFIEATRHFPEVNTLINSCKCKVSATIMVLPPLFSMNIHKDVHFLDSRKTALFTPLLPIDDIAPTLFWEDEKPDPTDVPFMTIDWVVGESKILNVMPYWHNVYNNEKWRAMLQFSFDRSYEEVLDLINGNELFEDFDCVFA